MKLYIIIALIIIELITQCTSKKIPDAVKELPKNQLKLTPEQLSSNKIELVNMATKEIEKTIDVKGKVLINPNNFTSITINTRGIVEKLMVNIGDNVAKGQILLQLKNNEIIQLQQDYLKAKAQSVYLANDMNRQKELNEIKATSDKVYHQVSRDYSLNTIEINAIKSKLELIGIAPKNIQSNHIQAAIPIKTEVSGIISKINIHKGSFVNEGDEMMIVSNATSNRLVFQVFEKDINYVHIGQTIHFQTNNSINNPQQCIIKTINTTLNSDNSLDIYCDLTNNNLYGNTIVTGKIIAQKTPSLVLPVASVVSFDGKNYVFYQENDIFQMIEVQTGSSNAHEIEIKFIDHSNTVNMNRKWVSNGAYNLLMKIKNTAE